MILRPGIGRLTMNHDGRALVAAILRAVADYVERGGDLVGRLDALVKTAKGDVLPGDPRPIAIPPRAIDAVERRGIALALVRDRGRLTSGELARAAYCDPETARLTLGDLTRKGILARRGAKRGAHYLPGPRFDRLG